MARFLHTADWQLGMKGRGTGRAAETVRRVRIATANALLAMAREETVDFVIVAGDVFESNAVDRDTVEQALEGFEQVSPLPVYILPGNHDPLEPDSVYLQRVWKSCPSHVRVLTERKPVMLDEFDAILYPCPLSQKRSRSDPTEWIPRQDTGQIRIGIAHGTLDVGLTKEPNFPINPRRVEESSLDYLALGDWHSLFVHADSAGAQRTVYPGTPEATAFGERDPGHALVVEVRKREAPEIEVKNCARLQWKVWEEDIESEQDILALADKAKRLDRKDDTLLRLLLKGAVDAEVYNMAGGLGEMIGNVLYLDVESRGLHLKPSARSMVGVVPEGTLRRVAESLEALLSREPSFSRLVQVPHEQLEERLKEIKELGLREQDPAVLQRALSLLYQMSKEGAR